MDEMADTYASTYYRPYDVFDTNKAVCKYCGGIIVLYQTPSNPYAVFNIDNTPHDCLDPFKLMKEFES